jgi:hypothetical protein
MHEKQAALRGQFSTLLKACTQEQADNLRTAVKNARLVGAAELAPYKNAAFTTLVRAVGALISDVAPDTAEEEQRQGG